MTNNSNDIVPVSAIDFDEIKRRGGANLGEEDYDLVRCASCGRVYLIECEVFTVLVDAEDLQLRADPDNGFNCLGCGWKFPFREAWLGPTGPAEMKVTWAQLLAGPWSWILKSTQQ